MKLTPVFMFAVMAIVSAVMLIAGPSAESVIAGFVIVCASAFLIEPAKNGSFRHRMAGEIGENIEKEYKEVKANLTAVNDNLKSFAEESQKQIKNFGSMTEETKASVDKMLVTQGELGARLAAAEQALADGRGGDQSSRPQSMGRRVAESEEFKANADRLARAKGSFSIPVQAALTESTDSAGDLIRPDRVAGIVTPPEQRLTIRGLLSWGRTTSNSVEYVKETGFTNNAAPVSENPSGGKPESDLVFDLSSAPIATIAHWIHASKQVLSDAGMLQAYIDGRLRYGLKLKEEAQLLKGSGVGLNINGLYTQASAYANPGVDVTEDTAIDRIRIALLQVTLAEYESDGIVLNPIDWTGMELTKNTQGNYIFGNPMGLSGPVLWGRPVVATQSLDAGEFMTGAFRMGAQGWDREDASVMISTEDRDNFIKNMVTILCEERIGLTVYRPEAFVKGDLTIASSGA